MDHVLHEMRDSDSFKSSSSPEKQDAVQGSAVIAAPQDLSEPAAVPERDGGSTASTSESDDP